MANEEIVNSMDELLKNYDVMKLNRGDILKGTWLVLQKAHHHPHKGL